MTPALYPKLNDPRTGCAHCGQPMKDHYAVNYSDGQMVAATVMICPTSVFNKQK